MHGKFVLIPQGASTRVFRHAQVVEDQAGIAHELPHLLRHTANTFGFDDTDGKASQAGDVFRAVTGSYPAAVFVKVPVDDVMAAILDAPVASVGFEHLLGVGLVGGSAGDAVGELDGAFAGFLLDALAFDDEGLTDVGEVKVVVQCGSGPDLRGSRYARVRGRAPQRSPVPVDSRNGQQCPRRGGAGCL